MLKRIKSWLFPESVETQELTKINIANNFKILLERIEANTVLIENLQERILGLEAKYQSYREFKPIPTGHSTFRAQRQSLERGAYAKTRNSSTS